MTDIRALVQTTLDIALSGIKSYWLEKKELATDQDEYIVYTAGGKYGSFFSDDARAVIDRDVTISYYHRSIKADTSAGRAAIWTREAEIESALLAAGFETSSGFFDAGDVDGIGFDVSVSEWTLSEVAE